MHFMLWRRGGSTELRRWAVACLLLVSMLGLVAASPPAGAVTTEEGFAIDTIMDVGGVFSANAMAFIPEDQLVLIVHNDGWVDLWGEDGRFHGEILRIDDEVNTDGDRGMTGIALHPDFANPTNPQRLMYLWYGWEPPGLVQDSNTRRIGRLESFELTPVVRTFGAAQVPSYEVDESSRRLILGAANLIDPYPSLDPNPPGTPTGELTLEEVLGEDPDCTATGGLCYPRCEAEYGSQCVPVEACRDGGGYVPEGNHWVRQGGSFIDDCLAGNDQLHNTGTLRFGPDGMLYVGFGDGSSAIDADERALSASDPDSLNGKILRIDPATGLGLPDNPWYDGDVTANRARVYAGGFRNPFRFSVHPERDEVMVGDVGFSDWEEVNTGRGTLHGWPCFEGGNGTSLPQGAYGNLQACQDAQNDLANPPAGYVPPTPAIHAYHHQGGTAAVIGGDWYLGTDWPLPYQDAWFFNEFDSGELRYLPAVRDGDGDVIGYESESQTLATGLGMVVDTQIGPDGELWMLEIGRFGPDGLEVSGRIIRARFVGDDPDRAPVLTGVPDQQHGIGAHITLQILGYDPDGLPLTFSTDPATPLPPGLTLSGEGRVTGTTTSSGIYPVTIVASDGTKETTTSFTWTVDSTQAPQATILSPTQTDGWTIGDTVTLSGEAFDGDEGALTGDALQWTVDLYHGDHVHPDHYTGTGTDPAPYTIEDHGAGEWYLVVCLTVTDSDGYVDRKCTDLRLGGADYTVRTEPPGLVFSLDGEPQNQAATFTLVDGETVELDAPLAQQGLTFVGWSSGRASTQTIVAGTGPFDLVARYEAVAAPSNVALTGTARQSSTHTYPVCGPHSADRAIDGDLAGYEDDCSISHTQDGLQMWWEVDLGSTLLVEEVRVFNWVHHQLERLSDGVVFVSPTPFGDRSFAEIQADPTVFRQAFAGTIGRPTVFPSGVRGRYVRVQLANPPERAVVMSEVQVIAGPQRPPVLVLGPDPDTVDAGTVVRLDASDSIDPDGADLTFAWTVDGDSSRFNDPAAAEPFLDTSGLTTGDHLVDVTVTDVDGMTTTGTVTVSVISRPPPVAVITDPGGPFTVGDDIVLDGSPSNDPAGGGLGYAWDLDGDGQFDDAIGPTATLSTDGLPAGPHTVGLQVVSDLTAKTGTTTATVQIEAPPEPPVVTIADTGGPHERGTPVPLDASGSTDPEGDATTLSFAWDLDADGLFDDATGAQTTFDTTDLPQGSYPVQVRVTSTVSNLSAVAHATVNVIDIPMDAPVANVTGPTDPVSPGETFTLDASGSTDPEGDATTLSFVWDVNGDGFDAGEGDQPTLELSEADLGAGEHEIAVQATSSVSGLSGTATHTVVVHGRPVASLLQPTLPYRIDQQITMDATGTVEPQDAPLVFAWDIDADGVYDSELGDGPTATFPASTLGRGVHHVRVLVRSTLTNATDHALVHLVIHEPPTAVVEGPAAAVTAGQPAALDASGSTDPHADAESLQFRWDLDGDGQFDDAEGPTTILDTTSLPVGEHEVAVTATSAGTGLSDVANTRVIVQSGSGTGGTPGGGVPGGGGPIVEPPTADLSVGMALRPREAVAGQPVEATVAVTNHGPDEAQAFVAVTLDGLDGANAPADCRVTDDRLSCEAITLASGASESVTFTVRPTVAAAHDLVATVTAANATDPDPTNDRFEADLLVRDDGSASTPTATAIALSAQVFADAGTGADANAFAQDDRIPARHVVLSRVDDFADSLAGTALAGEGPMLFTDSALLTPATLAEIQRVLGGDGTVYVLGGSAAVGDAVAAALADEGFTVERLEGPTRVETALAVADEVVARAGEPGQLALARANGPSGNPTAAWADSVSAGGWAARTAQPILLTQTDALHPAVAQWLDAHPTAERLLLGGEAALSATVADAVGAATRLEGANRYGTAATLSQALWESPSGALVTAGNHVDGWAYGLASASLAASSGHPLLLVETTRLPAETDTATCLAGDRIPVEVVGDTSVVSTPVVEALTGPC